MTQDSKIVAVALLTQRDLEVIGTGLDRVFPVRDLDSFEDLLAQLDACEATGGMTKSSLID